MINPHRYCVIMCGGIGSRFWPYSREGMPKQFLDFFGTGRSLLRMSYERVLPIVAPENIIVVTNKIYQPLIKAQLPELKSSQILCEPARRNTAPCVAWAAYHIQALDPEASIIVTPSDHLITAGSVFEDIVVKGFEFVESNDALLTLGITPTRPETGYGYIQVGEEVTAGVNKVKTFTEKPNADLAKVFIETGEFFWNSGIFLWRASTILNAIKTHLSDLTVVFEKGVGVFGNEEAEMKFINANFPSCPGISIDYAVMERADNVYVERADFGWSDLGTWGALYDISPKNRDRNVTQNCKVIAYNSEGNIFAVKGDKLVVVSGLKDYIISDAGDVLLVCPRSEEQGIRQVVNDVKLKFGDTYL